MRGVVDLYVFSNKNASKHSHTTIVSYQTIEKFKVHIWAQYASVFLGLRLKEFAKTITKWWVLSLELMKYYQEQQKSYLRSLVCLMRFYQFKLFIQFWLQSKRYWPSFQNSKWNCCVKQQSIKKWMLLKLGIRSFWSHLIRENLL